MQLCVAEASTSQRASCALMPAGPDRPVVQVQMAGGSGVELAGEVFQAAIDLDGDHAVAGAEAAGDAHGGGEVGAGRGSGEDAFGTGRVPSSLERLGLRDGHHFVIIRGVQLGRPVADPAALNVMNPG